MTDFAARRQQMVEQQLKHRGIRDVTLLQAMTQIPRHRFLPNPDDAALAYADHPLPIGYEQTISQPYMVARTCEFCQLEPEDRVLEVGAGSGYQTAILARLCARVYALEIVPELAERAQRLLHDLGIDNVELAAGDGSCGWPEHAPFDAIVVAAGAPSVPEPLKQQLADGGRLVIPVGDLTMQQLVRLTRAGRQYKRDGDTLCRFVQLRGKHGWG